MVFDNGLTPLKAGDKLVLPVDNVVADRFAEDAATKVVSSSEIPADMITWSVVDTY